MRVNENYSYVLNRMIIGLHNFIGISIGMILLFIFVRIIEWATLFFTNSGISNLHQYELMGLLKDFLFVVQLTSYFFIPIIILSIIIDFRVVNFFHSTIGMILLLVYLLLVVYFCNTFNLLGADVFSYNKDEIQLIIGSTNIVTWYNILLMAILIYAFYKIPLYFIRINWPFYSVIIYAAIAIFSWVSPLSAQPNQINFKKEINYFIVCNKYSYFIESLKENVNTEEEMAFDGFYFDDDITGQSFKFLDPQNFPFLSRDTIQNTLGNYFGKFSRSPNIVIIIVEGLGRSYSGPDAELGSFTPFLDSLSTQSLYWRNFLSNGGRTFAALPSILSSSPFGKRGILELGENMPNQQSLIRLLKANGYYTSFFHGGDIGFDNMDTYLRKQGVDRVIDKKSFPKEYKMMPTSDQKFTWGYGDIELFNYYNQIIKSEKVEQPRLDIFLTLSNHSPFRVLNQSYYDAKFDKQLENLGVEGEGRNTYNSYKKMYSCILYTDDAIRRFIESYKKNPDYDNTIFIITGDHRMPEIPIENRLDHFRVPLIIASSKLNRPTVFRGVSSHLDITPSLISFLRLGYNLKRPVEQSWIGGSLDTSRYFISNKFIPMMRNKNELLDFVDRSNYFADKKVLVLKEKLQQVELTDAVSKKNSEARIGVFKQKNEEIERNRKIIPDSTFYYKVPN